MCDPEADEYDGPVEIVTLPLPLDQATIRWLSQMCGGCDHAAAELIASLVRSIRIDDEAAHSTMH